jgi:hypothetical protein
MFRENPAGDLFYTLSDASNVTQVISEHLGNPRISQGIHSALFENSLYPSCKCDDGFQPASTADECNCDFPFETIYLVTDNLQDAFEEDKLCIIHPGDNEKVAMFLTVDYASSVSGTNKRQKV